MTEEEIDALVQEKVYGVLLPWEKNPRPKGSCNTFRAQERTLRAIIMLQKFYGTANRNLVMQITGYSKWTHCRVVSNLRKKGAIENLREHKWCSHRRMYIPTIGRLSSIESEAEEVHNPGGRIEWTCERASEVDRGMAFQEGERGQDSREDGRSDW
jgi:hypothetical protein